MHNASPSATTHSGANKIKAKLDKKNNDKQHYTTGYAERTTQIKLQLKRKRTIESLPKICTRTPTLKITRTKAKPRRARTMQPRKSNEQK